MLDVAPKIQKIIRKKQLIPWLSKRAPPQTYEAPQEANKREKVISLHGIRTRGEWQKNITPHLNSEGFDHCPFDYGKYPARLFLWKKSRQKKITEFIEKYDEHIARYPDSLPHAIAHSMGSYIVVRALQQNPHVRFKNIILCGTFLQPDFNWDAYIQKKQVESVYHQLGKRDLPVKLATWCISDGGKSGSHGFDQFKNALQTNLSEQSFPEMGHSGFFSEGNVKNSWCQFLKGKELVIFTMDAPKVNYRFIFVSLSAFLISLVLGYLLLST